MKIAREYAVLKSALNSKKSVVEIILGNAKTSCMRVGLPSTKADRYDILLYHGLLCYVNNYILCC